MLRSMTAFGRATVMTPNGSYILEIHSVNRKTLDIAINIPRELLFADIEMRQWISEKIKRGKIQVRLVKNTLTQNLEVALPDLQLLKNLKEQWDAYNLSLGFDRPITLEFLVSEIKKFSHDEMIDCQKTFITSLKDGFDKALLDFCKMKDMEGKALFVDMKERITLIEKSLFAIEKLAPGSEKKYREKILEKMNELIKISSDDEDRALREAIVYAEKVDITEEIIRLKSHILQFDVYCSSSEIRIGRTLEFLIQEMQREINTIGSKTQEMEIVKNTLKMKSELEKIREQVQNIE